MSSITISSHLPEREACYDAISHDHRHDTLVLLFSLRSLHQDRVGGTVDREEAASSTLVFTVEDFTI
jgi:hypothetical protein